MKLRDLVANSLPRVRGRKKKVVATAASPVSPVEPAVKPEVVTCRSDLEKNRLPSVCPRSVSRDDSLELQAIAEASWRGNVLYRGLEAARTVKYNSRLMSASYTTSHGMVTSHSAEGFSSQMMSMSGSYDSRMIIPDCNDSCPQMSAISETCMEPFPSSQQYYHCHYHRHNHHHYHHHHLHPKSMTPVEQHHQKIHPDVVDQPKYLSSNSAKEEPKSEPGFFRKSFATLGGIRKHSSKSKKESKQNGADKIVSTVCPYSETDAPLGERKTNEKRPTKPKRKSLKGFSKQKENKEAALSDDKCDKSWYSDNDAKNMVSPTIARTDPAISMMFGTFERTDRRERSVESCSSRLYGSREGSAIREVDFTGFDSASLSGYESDLPRSKVHRSRSRIKTNPWLPSPQPSMSGATRAQHIELRESTEDVSVAEGSRTTVPRSASFQYQRSEALSSQSLSQNEALSSQSLSQNYSNRDKSLDHRPRSLTPSDIHISPSLNPTVNSPSVVVTPTWCPPNRHSDESEHCSRDADSAKVRTMNDLSNDPPKSRPSSTVSPNSEFVMLADNLEQLANNISFEYEEMLDNTLESVSICQEDGQTSIQELLTDEENGNVAKTFLKSDGDIHSAHSPDSGVCGLGSTDGDEILTPNAQTEQSVMSLERLACSSTAGEMDNSSRSEPNLELPIFKKEQNPPGNKSMTEATKCSARHASGSSSSCVSPSLCVYNTSSKHFNNKNKRGEGCGLDNDNSATFSESDIDNTSYQDTCLTTSQDISSITLQDKTSCTNKPPGNVLHSQKQDFLSSVSKPGTGKSINHMTLMVDERLDIEFHPSHRQLHVPAGGVTGPVAAMQTPGKIAGLSSSIFRKNPRPCSWKASLAGPDLPHRMNDMEKCSSQVQQRRSWSTEFDFPRNITNTECVESPTENWRCDDQLLVSVNQDVETLHPRGENKQPLDCGLPPQERIVHNGTPCIDNEELIVKLSEFITTSGTQSDKTGALQTDGFVKCLDKQAAGSHDSSNLRTTGPCDSSNLQMNDASVQTDFDDEFSKWDVTDTLESMEDNVLDPAESTRRWLLSGNMQGSADTGYCSLTRDSQIFMDEDSLFIVGEMEERAAAERLSYVEPSSNESVRHISQPECDFMKVDSHTIVGDKYNLQQMETVEALTNREHTKDQNEKTTQQFSEKESVHYQQHHNSHSNDVKISNFTRIVPHGTVLRTFSNMDPKFESYLNLRDDNRRWTCAGTRSSSDSSDQTLKSSDSDDFDCMALQQYAAESTKIKDSETGETKVCTRSKNNKGLFKEDYKHISHPSFSKRMPTHNWPPDQNGVKARLVENGRHVEQVRAKHDPSSNVYGLDCCPKDDLFHPSSAGVRRDPPSSERADYLEFLKDAPLNRSHLKRPLFLVPGVGPVDMSCSEQMSLFAEAGTPFITNRPPCSTSPSTQATTPSMSPSTAHCGKKLKYKKGDYTICSDHVRSHVQTDARLSSKSASSSVNHSQHALSGRQDQSTANCSRNQQTKSALSDSTSGGRYMESNSTNLQRGDCRCASSSQNTQQPLQQSSQAPSDATGGAKTSDGLKRKDDITRSLRERVMSLRREKDVVFLKIQEAREDERLRQEQRLQVQGHMHAQRKEALLETLHELKNKLEEQSKLLKQREASTADT